jgi:hypothetical protein
MGCKLSAHGERVRVPKQDGKIDGYGVMHRFQAQRRFFGQGALTALRFVSINPSHEKFGSYSRGGTAHGQDGVTIRR